MNFLKRYLQGFLLANLFSWAGVLAAMILISFITWSWDGFTGLSWSYIRFMTVWTGGMAFLFLPKK
ncbi:hypothetical protein pEaSNUABM56_00199 [Erwinia phage pEa_SNUABM_56]|uniref:Uncharacterized protein n=1 Tax=Erwinia phage pEp_SNUABM_01 TaxID=2601643 RepID=A0A5J6DBS5_9CAUD|nr:hypothetical protein HWC63_gp203 [Erwinia phage pEp_SNUABM_01]QEQ94975.1 hypothetical protein pEpSNUABM01_149 [Erwinia phage pEp_SNUABM_01]UYL84900.1 hypothetical protein pEaSNUABM55_00127 [Erwinia phage pEa_SNUABM_55]UYL85219.1 hypothetical protein pEaSNUABM56_00199 [Erwinia phage pEa_SNUABM_56]